MCASPLTLNALCVVVAGVDVAMNTHLKTVKLVPKGKNPINVDQVCGCSGCERPWQRAVAIELSTQ